MDKCLFKPRELSTEPESPDAARTFLFWVRTVEDFIDSLRELGGGGLTSPRSTENTWLSDVCLPPSFVSRQLVSRQQAAGETISDPASFENPCKRFFIPGRLGRRVQRGTDPRLVYQRSFFIGNPSALTRKGQLEPHASLLIARTEHSVRHCLSASTLVRLRFGGPVTGPPNRHCPIPV